ncbi:electron transport complex subunit RsxC [Iocasia frigidifontis]|uniref:Ion-translocating oxidoreductase complex subunit C n=1 Tax=Iocasia fonsfrigidae TaxID=2682810 RepID=A0A8A7K6A3_9FIRM|nr:MULTISPECIES: electron transport complex subunit RsxC [Halanaerobiaceae]AZO94298.1 electron transport complex subunit RsxC [Halocella sp. SP3-1]QTL97246.1 electron transport complex subunit RsxC [Iocasia fonsfrigidae]
MGVLTFKQGIHPEYNKQLSKDKPFKKAKRPEIVTIPLQQHIGAPCKPLVKKGDHVDLGQKIGDSDSFVSAPVHASVSGVIKEIKKVMTPVGKKADAIVIEADEEDLLAEGIKPRGELAELDPADIKDIVREAGIVGMGGAMFPTHVKLAVPDGKEVEYIILNGAECEPYLTVDHRMMIERPGDIVFGLQALMKATGAKNGIIGIEENKPEAIEVMQQAVLSEEGLEVKVLATKYPQGGEKMLIKAILDREVPAGGLPLDVGVVVNNISTAVAVRDAIKEGMPLVERSVTVTGRGIKEPINLIYRIGTLVSELIAEAGGFVGKPGKVILGGPMTGFAQTVIDLPAVKGTSGVLVLPEDEVADFEPAPCIKCARCVDVCPQFLMPVNLANYTEHEMFEELEKYQILNCIECGSCSFICPAKRPLMQYIKMGKAEVIARKRKEK